jgi:hypothetical protein
MIARIVTNNSNVAAIITPIKFSVMNKMLRRSSKTHSRSDSKLGHGSPQDSRDHIRLRLDRAPVGLHHVRKQHGVRESMVHIEPRADRVRNGVRGAEALLKRRRPHRGRREHVRSGLDIATVDTGLRQEPRDQAHALESYAIGDGVKCGTAVSLECEGSRAFFRSGDRHAPSRDPSACV